MSKTNKFQRSVARLTIQRILNLIAKKPLTRYEISQRLHLSETAACDYLAYLRQPEHRQVHIAAWSFDAVGDLRPMLRPLYKAGAMPDAPKPPPRSANDVSRAYRRRVKEDPDKYERASLTFRAHDIRRNHKRRLLRAKRLSEAGFGDLSTVSLLRARVLTGTKHRSPTPSQVTRIIEMRDGGANWRAIAKDVGVSETTAKKYYQQITS